MADSELPIFFGARTVGRVRETPDGPSFAYDPSWLATPGAFPVSTGLPLGTAPADPVFFTYWAANLLPESRQLQVVGRRLGVATGDVIGLLSEIGRDTAGALSIGRPGAPGPGGWVPVPSEAALERIIEELPHKPFLIGEDGISMSLAGVQSKLGVALDEAGRMHVPHDGSPSTHILKPSDPQRLPGAAQNEAFCLTLAALCGLDVPEVATGRAGARTYFLIRRYDRQRRESGHRRLHGEDFCQALGYPPALKYEGQQTAGGLRGRRGPTFAEMHAHVRRVAAGDSQLRLWDHLAFNVLVNNTDAHAKNYSLLIDARGARLAPLYDVMCATVWDGITKNLAHKIAGKNRGDHVCGRHWERLARECGLRPAAMLRRVERLAKAVLAHAPAAEARVAAMPAGPEMLPQVRDAVEYRARAVLSNLAETEPSPGEEPVAGPAP